MGVVETATLFQATVELLEQSRIEYMTIGGIAAGIWGEPRDTKDADFIVVLSANQVGPLLLRARESGYEIDEQVILMNLQISGVARLLYGGRFADFIVGESPFDTSALSRRQGIKVFERTAWVASPEDLILYKMVAMRDQDIADVRRILIRQNRALDVGYMTSWAAVLSDKIGKPEIASRLEGMLTEYGLGV